MKTILFFFGTAIIICGACSKSSSKPAQSPLTSASLSGYWYGTFSGGNEGQVFKTDGTTVQYDFYGVTTTDTATAPYKAYGTYTIQGDSIIVNLTYPTLGNESFNEHALVNTNTTPNTITGTYTGAQAGSYSLRKQ